MGIRETGNPLATINYDLAAGAEGCGKGKEIKLTIDEQKSALRIDTTEDDSVDFVAYPDAGIMVASCDEGRPCHRSSFTSFPYSAILSCALDHGKEQFIKALGPFRDLASRKDVLSSGERLQKLHDIIAQLQLAVSYPPKIVTDAKPVEEETDYYDNGVVFRKKHQTGTIFEKAYERLPSNSNAGEFVVYHETTEKEQGLVSIIIFSNPEKPKRQFLFVAPNGMVFRSVKQNHSSGCSLVSYVEFYPLTLEERTYLYKGMLSFLQTEWRYPASASVKGLLEKAHARLEK